MKTNNQTHQHTMKTQQDHQVRVVALTNLEAMCERVSGVCHRYWIESVTQNRVKVGYSNPDEYGNADPMFAYFPAYKSVWPGDKDNPRIVLDIQRVTNDPDEIGDQCFLSLIEAEKMWRAGLDGSEWHTDTEAHKAQTKK